ncbi:MAG: peptidase C11 [Clostridia bacterium]|nr:peptidase C11 [Clostridia bacterium]MBQ9993873.1 peptidase C11 [Clostridia bacterium]
MDRKSGGRKKKVTGGTANFNKRGDAINVNGGKPVGKADGYQGRKEQGKGGSRPSAQGGARPSSAQGGSPDKGLLSTLLGAGLSSLGSSGGSSSGNSSSGGSYQTGANTSSLLTLSGIISLLKRSKIARIIALILVVIIVWNLISGGGQSCSLGDMVGFGNGIVSVAGDNAAETEADLSVSNQARDKRTIVRGGGDDVFTIMVYMCGTDLESKYGMATADLKEMIASKVGGNVNLIVETGGTQQWKNSTVSNSTNQIYKVTGEGMILLGEVGKKPMTDPATLSEFIQYSMANYPADRYGLIFWDHGGGSVSGYGYDQHYPNGAMTLDKINTALKNGGCVFDFIGFDACLMATLETALVAEQYADYLIASEETEPGVGWYYTNWLNKLTQNTSMKTVEIGKNIIDDFVDVCYKASPNDKTTLSIIDLAELAGTVPESFTSFAQSTSELIENNNYKQVSDARSNTKEFASGINQVDLIHLAKNIGTDESKSFAKVLESCVKYNRTSSNIANANGISIYFPYGKTGSVSSAVSTYDKIGLDDSYIDCIKSFASLSAGGQIASGTTPGGSLLGSLLGGGTGSSSGSGGSLLDMISLLGGSSSANAGSSNVDLLGTALSLFLGNNNSASATGIDVGQLASWFSSSKVLDNTEYYQNHYLDPDRLTVTDKEGVSVLSLTDAEWDLVQNIQLNVFLDDGAGYIDLGMDNVYEFDDDGDLVLGYDGTWLTINGHAISYYMISEDRDGDDYVITGYSPILLNGELMDLIIVFDNEHEDGVIAGARIHYGSETDTVAKGLCEIKEGDVIDFLCDYYTYDGDYQNSYMLGDQLVVDGELTVSNMSVGDMPSLVTYCLTDMYGNELWTPAIEY